MPTAARMRGTTLPHAVLVKRRPGHLFSASHASMQPGAFVFAEDGRRALREGIEPGHLDFSAVTGEPCSGVVRQSLLRCSLPGMTNGRLSAHNMCMVASRRKDSHAWSKTVTVLGCGPVLRAIEPIPTATDWHRHRNS
jgi:hypothetical protein